MNINEFLAVAFDDHARGKARPVEFLVVEIENGFGYFLVAADLDVFNHVFAFDQMTFGLVEKQIDIATAFLGDAHSGNLLVADLDVPSADSL